MEETLGKRIMRHRKSLGLTQDQLAEKLFVTRQTVSLWENGKTQPDVQTLERIAAVFQVDLMTVLYGGNRARTDDDRYRQRLIWWALVSFVLCGFLYLLQALASEHLIRRDGSWLMWLGLVNYHLLFPAALLGCGGWLAYLMERKKGVSNSWRKKIVAAICLAVCLVCALSWWIPFFTQNLCLRQLHIDLYYGTVSCQWLQPALGYGIVWSIYKLRK